LLVTYSDFLRTTSEVHKQTCQRLWERCAAKGDIYLDAYEGWYNEREETFVTDMEAEANEFKDPASGLPLKRVVEESYFFRMSKYCDVLIDYINRNPRLIEPETHRKGILTRLTKEGLKDLSISRTSFSWGIPVPDGFDKKHVMYVWFDALTNYLTGVRALDAGDERSGYWPASHHIIGKDIVWFHCVIWPCMLLSADIPLPDSVFSHGFVNDSEGRKMSKSLGNVVDPHTVLEKYSADSLRYYTAASITYGSDLNFSDDALTAMHNSELADVLGNLVHRVFNLAQKYCGGVVPDTVHDTEFALPFDLKSLKENIAEDMKNCAINLAVFKAMDAARATNKFLTDAEPWKMKGDREHKRAAVVRTAMEAIYAFSHFLAPVIPIAAQHIFTHLHTTPRSAHNLRDDFYNLTPGTPVTVGDILFKKIEKPEEDAAAATPSAAASAGGKKKGAAAAMAEEEIEHAIDFTKLDIRVGEVVKVWHHPTADRLFVEEIDVGEATPRQVVSGLRSHYSIEQFTGRKVLVVCNLKESKFQGQLSNGMVLAAKNADGSVVELISAPVEAANGERVFVPGHEAIGRLPQSAWNANRIKKSRIWETVSPLLNVNADHVASLGDLPLTTSAGVCTTTTLAAASIQ
jgi:methionyl-tRNA synthetase